MRDLADRYTAKAAPAPTGGTAPLDVAGPGVEEASSGKTRAPGTGEAGLNGSHSVPALLGPHGDPV